MPSEDEMNFVVEKILHEKRESDGTIRYLVKWEGFPYEQCSYEPLEHFNSQETLKSWRDKHDTGLEQAEVHRIEARMAHFKQNESLQVEEILHQKKWGGTLKYLVKWVGYGEEECTWEPRQHLGNPQLLKNWQRKWTSGHRISPKEYKRIAKLRLAAKLLQRASSGTVLPSIEVEDVVKKVTYARACYSRRKDLSSSSEDEIPRKKQKVCIHA